jgi:hypothetical protein
MCICDAASSFSNHCKSISTMGPRDHLKIFMVSALFHNTISKDECSENLESFEFGRNVQIKHRLSFVNLRQGTQMHRIHRIALSINE